MNPEPEDFYQFTDIRWRSIAFHHPSASKNHQFQRLEFLGDRLISETLVKWVIKNKTFSEKHMSQWLSGLICASAMAEVGYFLEPHITYTGQINNNILCDVLEAWIGAIFLDGGNYHKIVLDLWGKLLDQEPQLHYKNQLQEYCHKNRIDLLVEYEYNQNNLLFCVVKCLDKRVSCSGTSKKIASAAAHKKMYQILTKQTPQRT